MATHLAKNMEKRDKSYKISKTDEELRVLILQLQIKYTDKGFADFCNIVISRASKCWQSGLEDYAFGEKNFNDGHSKITVLEILNIVKGKGSYYDWSYVSYIKESLCLYHEIVERQFKLKRILKWN